VGGGTVRRETTWEGEGSNLGYGLKRGVNSQ